MNDTGNIGDKRRNLGKGEWEIGKNEMWVGEEQAVEGFINTNG